MAEALAAGLVLVDLRRPTRAVTFSDVAAVIYFLRKVISIVPGFFVDRYRYRLAELHHHVQADGPFVAHAQPFLIDVRRPT